MGSLPKHRIRDCRSNGYPAAPLGPNANAVGGEGHIRGRRRHTLKAVRIDDATPTPVATSPSHIDALNALGDFVSKEESFTFGIEKQRFDE